MSDKTDRATPRPWRIETGRATDHVADDIFIVDANGTEVAKLATSLDESDGEKAALIVAAVNSHYAMLLLAEGVRRLGDKSARRGFKVTVDEVKGYARTALALARGN